MKSSLPELISQHVKLTNPNSTGWRSCLCKVCHDHGHKGTRGGFQLDLFTGTVVYSCFNCGHISGYSPGQHLSNKMKVVLDAFQIPEVDYNLCVFNNLGAEQKKIDAQIQKITPDETTLPKGSYLLQDIDDDQCQVAIGYLTDRCINWKDYPFYLVEKHNTKWYGRLIIPCYLDNKLVFYQGRDMTDSMLLRYLSPNIKISSVLYGYHNIMKQNDQPLYVVEGVFDAMFVDGVAIFSNKLSDIQIQWINKSNRTKVIIPDSVGNGWKLAEQALSLGWNVSLVIDDFGSCKDINAAVIEYGILYVLHAIKQNIIEDKFVAQTIINTKYKRR